MNTLHIDEAGHSFLNSNDGLAVTVDYPVGDAHADLLTRDGIIQIARRADELGFNALAFTEHPAPTRQWLESRAGHATLDVITALGFCAAVTERIQLMTYLLVVPYHNAYMAAKALATLDRLADGRLTVVAGTGYLRGEFEALGVDFGTRNARLDEGLRVMRQAWSGEPFDFSGEHFYGQDIVQRPPPVSGDRIPIWIGGNSTRARRRAACHQGWSPLVIDHEIATSVNTRGLSLDVLSEAIGDIRRSSPLADDFVVQVQTSHAYVLRKNIPVEEHLDHLGKLRDAGVNSFVLKLPNESVAAALEGLEKYAQMKQQLSR
jgi:probable F420-dependent oxidoreductase